MRFKVVVATYNVPDWIVRCMESIAIQDDVAFDVCIVDDASPEPQPKIIQEFCDDHNWSYVLNDVRYGGPLPNQVTAIHTLGGHHEDVIVFIDGDDWLPHAGVLSHLRHDVYNDPNIWVAYGTARCEPPSPTTDAARPHPPEAWQHPRSVRGWMWENGTHYNHIRTFRYGLFTHMKPAQWHWPDGSWFTANGDTVMMLPALEMAGYNRVKYMPEINYVYTPDHPQSEWSHHPDSNRVNPKFLLEYDPYPILESL